MTVVFKHIEISAPHDKIQELRNSLPNEALRASFDEKVSQLRSGSKKSRYLGVEVDGFTFAIKKDHSGGVILHVRRSPMVTFMFVLRFEKDYYTSNPALVFRPVVTERFADLQGKIDANILASRSWEEGINFRR